MMYRLGRRRRFSDNPLTESAKPEPKESISKARTLSVNLGGVGDTTTLCNIYKRGNVMFKKKIKVSDYFYFFVNRNYELNQDIEVNPVVFNQEDIPKLERYLKLYKMSLGHIYLVGKKHNGDYIQNMSKLEISTINEYYYLQIEDLVSQDIISVDEYRMFEELHKLYMIKIKDVQFKPEQHFFHHILFFSDYIYPETIDSRKKEHLFDYCIQQYKILNNSFLKKVKLVF